jgi:hypothetical protein
VHDGVAASWSAITSSTLGRRASMSRAI